MQTSNVVNLKYFSSYNTKCWLQFKKYIQINLQNTREHIITKIRQSFLIKIKKIWKKKKDKEYMNNLLDRGREDYYKHRDEISQQRKYCCVNNKD